MSDQSIFQHVFDEALTACLVCGSSNLIDYKRDCREVLICRCRCCGFQFMNPQYEDSYIHRFYEDSYVDSAESHLHHSSHEYGFDYYLRLLETHTAPGKLLDIGCGSGAMLAAARRRGWQESGYDVDANSIKAVAERLDGATIFSGDFLELSESQKFDALTLHQVLEHVKNPNQYLQKMRKLLVDGGYAFIAVPNIHSFSNRLKFLLEQAGIRRKNIGKYYDTFHHLLYFTPATLRLLLRKHNFTVVYGRNCHKSKTKEATLLRILKHNISERIIPSSAFFVIARKDPQ